MSDPEGRRGFVGLADGQVTALDLNTGAVIWGRTGLGQPLAANLSRLLTLYDAGDEIILRLADAQTGQDVVRVSGLGLPSWAREVIGQPDAAEFYANNEGNGFRVLWSMRRPYRGGAPPGPTIADARPATLKGSILLDPTSGKVLDRGHETAPAGQPEAAASADPNVYAQEQIGDRIYRLKVAPPGAEHRAEITVEASSAASGNVEWETRVGAVPDSGPAPLPTR